MHFKVLWTLKAKIALSILVLLLLAWFYLLRPLEVNSQHFRMTATAFTSNKSEMLQGIAHGEKFYSAIAQIIPKKFKLAPVIHVNLNGNAGSEYSHVDGTGTVQLYRSSFDEGGYWSLFAHELVHAVGFQSAKESGALSWPSLGFYSEGWAEYLALKIAPDKRGFPFYGLSENVVVGYWLKHSDLTLEMLRNKHSELNWQCLIQAYPMRASWFKYVVEKYGIKAVATIMYSGREMTTEIVEEILGESLTVIDQDWKRWVLKNYKNTPESEKHISEYLRLVSYYQPC